jgi:protein tyrosine phosphatase (PTP) superfamily phosphohydrolase (DUF442 family)
MCLKKEDPPVFRWVIRDQLARAARPKYGKRRRGRQVTKKRVDAWIRKAKRDFGVRSIICLLDEEHLRLYQRLPKGLLAYYRAQGLTVKHIPVRDRQRPPMSKNELKRVWKAYNRLPKPVLIHCSAGIARTGRAVSHVKRKLKANCDLP